MTHCDTLLPVRRSISTWYFAVTENLRHGSSSTESIRKSNKNGSRFKGHLLGENEVLPFERSLHTVEDHYMKHFQYQKTRYLLYL